MYRVIGLLTRGFPKGRVKFVPRPTSRNNRIWGSMLWPKSYTKEKRRLSSADMRVHNSLHKPYHKLKLEALMCKWNPP